MKVCKNTSMGVLGFEENKFEPPKTLPVAKLYTFSLSSTNELYIVQSAAFHVAMINLNKNYCLKKI